MGTGFAGIFTGTKALQIDGGLQIRAGALSGHVLTSDANGNARWAAVPPGATGPAGAKGAPAQGSDRGITAGMPIYTGNASINCGGPA
jgi:hypothetical protein